MTFLRVPHGPKISRQSQNRQKLSKSHSKTDQKVVKKGQKRVKSLQENGILGVKKAWSWGSKSAKKCHFSSWEGSKTSKTVKKGQKLTNPESLAKSVRQTGMAKSKVRFSSDFDSFDKNLVSDKIQNAENHEK